MVARADAASAGLDAHHLHLGVVQEGPEEADRVTASADTRHEQIRQPAFALQDLPAGFIADDAVKIAHHHRVGM